MRSVPRSVTITVRPSGVNPTCAPSGRTRRARARTRRSARGRRPPAGSLDRGLARREDEHQSVALGDALRSDADLRGLAEHEHVSVDREDAHVTARDVRHEQVPSVARGRDRALRGEMRDVVAGAAGRVPARVREHPFGVTAYAITSFVGAFDCTNTAPSMEVSMVSPFLGSGRGHSPSGAAKRYADPTKCGGRTRGSRTGRARGSASSL